MRTFPIFRVHCAPKRSTLPRRIPSFVGAVLFLRAKLSAWARGERVWCAVSCGLWLAFPAYRLLSACRLVWRGSGCARFVLGCRRVCSWVCGEVPLCDTSIREGWASSAQWQREMLTIVRTPYRRARRLHDKFFVVSHPFIPLYRRGVARPPIIG